MTNSSLEVTLLAALHESPTSMLPTQKVGRWLVDSLPPRIQPDLLKTINRRPSNAHIRCGGRILSLLRWRDASQTQTLLICSPARLGRKRVRCCPADVQLRAGRKRTHIWCHSIPHWMRVSYNYHKPCGLCSKVVFSACVVAAHGTHCSHTTAFKKQKANQETALKRAAIDRSVMLLREQQLQQQLQESLRDNAHLRRLIQSD